MIEQSFDDVRRRADPGVERGEGAAQVVKVKIDAAGQTSR
jgi:hypothetical protein